MGQRANLRSAIRAIRYREVMWQEYTIPIRQGSDGGKTVIPNTLQSAECAGMDRIDLKIDRCDSRLAKAKIRSFRRILNMKEGYLNEVSSSFLLRGNHLKYRYAVFVSMSDPDLGVIRYSINLSTSKEQLNSSLPRCRCSERGYELRGEILERCLFQG